MLKQRSLTLPKEMQGLLERKQRAKREIKLIDADLRGYVQQLSDELGLDVPEEESAPAPSPPPPRERKPPGRRAKTPRSAVVEAVRRVGPGADVPAIRARLVVAGHDVEGTNIHSHLGNAVQRGELVRPAKGLYSTPEQEAK